MNKPKPETIQRITDLLRDVEHRRVEASEVHIRYVEMAEEQKVRSEKYNGMADDLIEMLKGFGLSDQQLEDVLKREAQQ